MGNAPSGLTEEVVAESGAATTPQQAGGVQLFKHLRGSGTGGWELVSSAAELDVFDANADSAAKAPEWHLVIEGAQDEVDTVIDDMFQFEPAGCRVTFNTADAVCWSLKFPGARPFERFLQQYNKALFENRSGLASTAEAHDKILPNLSQYLQPETDESREGWVEDMDTDKPDPEETSLVTPKRERVAARRESIHGLVMGAGDRSYVLRDNSEVDVMRNVQGGLQDLSISFKMTPPAGSARAGSATPTLTPGKVVLMSHESKMNMISPLAATSMFHADIETGKIVSEFSFQKEGVDVPIRDIATDSKSAQLEETSTFLGLDANRLARWDLRVRRGVVQEQMASPAALSYVGGKDYARGTKFSCMATSGAGYVVVGSDDGKVRLYSEKTLTQAKTAIPGLGLAITSVDVTYDGKWVLATTKNYLMVIKTTYKDKASGKESCGFTSKMGASAPAPRLLRLKTEDTALSKGAALEKGHFTWVTESGRQERWIVASCGMYTVLWNFRSVKVAEAAVVSYGGLTTVTQYHLVAKKEDVVDSVFMHDQYNRTAAGVDESAMVVVTKNAIFTHADDDSDEE